MYQTNLFQPTSPADDPQAVPLGKRSITDRTVSVEVYQNRINVIYPTGYGTKRRAPDRAEGDISRFSGSSRRRLWGKLLMLKVPPQAPTYFVTLTYHNEIPEDREAAKLDLSKFRKRLIRAFPDVAMVWRAELQKRGAIHYHLIIWGKTGTAASSTKTIRRWVDAAWNGIQPCGCRHCRQHSTRTDRMKNQKQAFAYVSKYVAKTDRDDHGWSFGRVWGWAGSCDFSPLVALKTTHYEARQLKAMVIQWLTDSGCENYWLMHNLEHGKSFSVFIEASHTSDWIRGVLNGVYSYTVDGISIPPPELSQVDKDILRFS